jgi:MFS family permease
MFGERVPFLLASIAAALTVWLTWRNLDETLTPEQRAANMEASKPRLNPAQVVQNSPLMLILLMTFATQFALGLLQATFALYGEAVLFADYSEAVTNLGIGLLLAAVGVGQVFTQIVLLRRMLERFGEGWLVVIGTGLRAMAFFTLAAAVMPWLAGFGTFFFAVGSGLMMPALQSMVTNTVGDHLRGGVLGLFQSAASLSIIFSTALGGSLFAIEPVFPYVLALTLMLILLMPSVYLMRWSNRQAEQPAGAQD